MRWFAPKWFKWAADSPEVYESGVDALAEFLARQVSPAFFGFLPRNSLGSSGKGCWFAWDLCYSKLLEPPMTSKGSRTNWTGRWFLSEKNAICHNQHEQMIQMIQMIAPPTYWSFRANLPSQSLRCRGSALRSHHGAQSRHRGHMGRCDPFWSSPWISGMSGLGMCLGCFGLVSYFD